MLLLKKFAPVPEKTGAAVAGKNPADNPAA